MSKRGLRPNTVATTIFAGACAVVFLWWHHGPSFSGAGTVVTDIGQVTGLLTGYAVVVLLALMARIPVLEQGLGADRLARWHSRGGRYTVVLAVTHALSITWGYALTDHRSVIGEFGVLLTQYADVLMATVALGLFVAIGITSARAARKRLRYETWLHIHFYTYLAIALSFSHQFATGSDFVNDSAARAVWATLYGGVAALLIWHRFITPLRNALRHDLRVAAVRRDTPDTVTLFIRGRHLSELHSEAGQFFRWRFLTRGFWWTTNPYSLSAVATDDFLRITVKALGDHSSSLADLPIGTRVIAEGPYGAMTPSHHSAPGVLLVAGGVGITPLRPLFEVFSAAQPEAVVLVYRARSINDILFKEELDAIAAHYGSKIIYAVGPRSSGANIVRPGILEQHVSHLHHRDVYVCGPKGLMDETVKALTSAGVKRQRIHFEDFSFAEAG
jgi:predicted ferric reductase